MQTIIFFILSILFLFHANDAAACGQVSNYTVEPLYGQAVIDIEANGKKEQSLTITHEIEKQDVLIEAKLKNVTLTKDEKNHVEGQGHIHLYVDGQLVDSIYRTSFIIKGLPTGNHQLKIEIVKNNDKPYGIEEEFTVSIP